MYLCSALLTLFVKGLLEEGVVFHAGSNKSTLGFNALPTQLI